MQFRHHRYLALGVVAAVVLTGSEAVFASYRVKAGVRQELNKAYGDGECVALVRQWTGAPQTATWKRGAQVKGANGIAVGTAIATFNAAGRYQGHAAIYQGQNKLGIQVIDQWRGQKAHRRTIRFGGKGTSNDGNQFYVVE